MRKLVSVLLVGAVAIVGIAGLAACHADEDDPKGQAKELSDPVRRANAVANLMRIYTSALDCCEKKNGECQECERSDPRVKKIADEIHDEVTQTYLDNEELHSTRTGLELVKLMREMRDLRTMPALLAALEWEREANEQHAITAAKTIRRLELPKDKIGEAIEKLSKALRRIDSDRGVDNQMRIAFIRTLGDFEDERAAPVLTEVMTTQSEKQDMLINRLAGQKLAAIADKEHVPAFIKALFLFDPSNPAKRMNDVAAEALVRIGQPAFDPLIEVLEGEHETANKLAERYIEAVKRKSKEAASQMSVDQLTSSEATYALGALGRREALGPLLAQANEDDIERQINAAIAMVRLNHDEGDSPKVRKALKKVYKAVGESDLPESKQHKARAQLTAALRHMYDGELLSFMLEQVQNTDMHPVVRLESVKAYAMLANKKEQEALRKAIEKDESGYKEKFKKYMPALDVAKECDENVACWREKLESSDEELLLKKASYMLGRLGRGEDKAINALVKKLDHREIEVRLAAVQALDRVATKGSQAAVDKISELRKEEEGRSIWSQFSKQALPIQARLRSRAT